MKTAPKVSKEPAFWWPRLILTGWICLSLTVYFTGWPWLWGMIPLAANAGLWVIPASLVGLALALGGTSIARIMAGGRSDFSSRRINISQGPHSKMFLYSAGMFVYAVIVSLGWILRSRNHFMGDGWAFIDHVASPFYFYKNEPLDFFLHQLSYRLLAVLQVKDGELAYAVLHCLLLPIFLLILWLLAGKAVRNIGERIFLWVIIASTSSLELFFGYVESYTIIHFWLAVYLLSGLKWMYEDRRGWPWLPTVIFFLAALSHKSGIVLFPSLLFIWLLRKKTERGTGILGSNSLWTAAASSISFVLAVIVFGKSLLVPLWGKVDGAAVPYLMFDWRHIWDKINFLLLNVPAAAVTVPFVVVKAGKWLKSRNPGYTFVFWAAVGSSFFCLVINPQLGIRDWDLLSLPCLPLSLFCAWTIIYIWPEGISRRIYLGASALVFFAHAMTWIWVNADMDRGVRFLDRVSPADFHCGSNRIQLAYMLFPKGYPREALTQYKAVAPSWANRAAFNLGNLFLELDMPDSTLKYFHPYLGAGMEAKPASQAFACLSVAYDMIGCQDTASIVFLGMLAQRLDPDETYREWWTKKMFNVAVRQKLEEKVLKNPENAALILFFLRYHYLSRDQENQAGVYNHILIHNFPLNDWLSFIKFAGLTGERIYLKLLAVEAVKQNPEIRKYLEPEVLKLLPE